METETLSNYDQSQAKHVLDESMDVNIPRNDHAADSLQTKEYTGGNSGIEHKEIISENTDGFNQLVSCKSLENKENVNKDCDVSTEETQVENKTDSDSDLEDKLDDERESVESEDAIKSLSESLEENTHKLSVVNHDDDEDSVSEEEKLNLSDDKFLLSDDEKDPLSDDGQISDDEKDSLNGDEKDHSDEKNKIENVLVNDVANTDKYLSNDEDNQRDEDPLGGESKDPADPVGEGIKDPADSLGEESKDPADPLGEESKDPADPLGGESKEPADSLDGESKDPVDPLRRANEDPADPLDNGNKDSADPLDGGNKDSADPLDGGNKDPADLLDGESKDPVNPLEDDTDKMDTQEADPNQQKEAPDIPVVNQVQDVSVQDKEKDQEEDKDDDEVTIIDDKKDKDEITIIDDKDDSNDVEEIKDSDDCIVISEKSDKSGDITEDCPLLKESLTKTITDDGHQKENDGENGCEDLDMDDDFDPSLLCPDIAMEVDEAPVITNSDTVPNDGSKSPSLYDPVFSTYVDEMTGAEVSFNLSAEEQHMRQEEYGERNPVQFTKIHCTACNIHLGSALDGQSNRFVHPLLKVLICKNCYHFYTSGEFEKDEDGSELYCRWCGQGGQVMCCSNCEMVFCKKCIRINYGRKKLTEIRDSDDWLCFRCNPSQLKSLRVHCAEFMEYVRREISRAATLENATSFTTTDYTHCCTSQKKKYTEPLSNEPKKKKRKGSVDPDYDPFRDQSSPQPSTSNSFPGPHSPKLVPILPKPIDAGGIAQASQNSAVFKVGNTTFKPRMSTFAQPRPRVQVITPVTSTTGIRPTISGPGYIKILPGGIRVTPAPARAAQTFVSSASNRSQTNFQQRRPAVSNTNAQMKHEWFEKTVRAAARVNSNLSYTLTQLNRAQATATSVEALAVVHNKLQEILSTSINSLIQIRKNLRTEFIAGIKNIRFPPKPAQLSPTGSSQDDDVIFISPTTSPIPPPLIGTTNTPTLGAISLPPSVSLTKRDQTSVTSPSTSADAVSISSKDNTDKPKIFLRVKSLTALQNVPSECITIPDDPMPTPPPLTPIKQNNDVTVIENSPEKDDKEKEVVVDVTAISDKDNTENKTESKESGEVITNGEKVSEKADQNKKDVSENQSKKDKPKKDKLKKDKLKKDKSKKGGTDLAVAFNLKDKNSPEFKKMLNTKVLLKRSEKIDEMVKSTFGLVNGNISE